MLGIISLISLFLVIIHALINGFVFWQALLLFIGGVLGITVLYIAVFFTGVMFYSKEKPIEKVSPFCHFGTRTILSLAADYLGVRLKINGMDKLPKDELFLLVSNHRSGFDPLLMIAKMKKFRIGFVSKPSNTKIPFIWRFAHNIGCLPIDRDNDREALKTILACAKFIKNGVCSVGIFPEGTRSKTGELGEFQAGSFKIAQKAGCPLVIASVQGTEKILKNALKGGTKVTIDFLEVIPADRVKATPTVELAAYSKSIIAESLEVQA